MKFFNAGLFFTLTLLCYINVLESEQINQLNVIRVRGVEFSSVYRRLESAGFNPGPYTVEGSRQLIDAIKQFQKLAKLPQTGVIDQKTWQILKMLYDPEEQAKDYRTSRDAIKKYWPLATGLVWKYQCKSSYPSFVMESGNSTTEKVVISQPVRYIKDIAVHPKRIEIDGRFSSVRFYTHDQLGIYFFGSQRENESTLDIASYPYYLIQYPVRLGNYWYVNSDRTLYLNESLKPIMKTSISELNRTIKTSKGSFQNCIGIESIYSSVRKNFQLKIEKLTWTIPEAEIYVKDLKWYAPDVGLVRRIHNEKLIRKDKKDRVYQFSLVENLNHFSKLK